MGIKVLVVGAGAQGRVIASLFDKDKGVELIKISDVREESLNYCMQHIKKAEAHIVSATEVDKIAKLAEDVDIIVNALPVQFNLNLMEAALKARTNYLDMAFEYKEFERILALNEKFRSNNLTALIAQGISPGSTDIAVALAADELDRVTQVKIMLADYADSDILFTTWSPEVLLDDCTRSPHIYEEGKIKYVEPFSDPEIVEFPEIGKVRVYAHPHEEVLTIPKAIKDVEKVTVKMGGKILDFFETLYNLGILYKNAMIEKKKVKVDSVEIDPADFILKFLPRPITGEKLKEYMDQGIVREAICAGIVQVRGIKDGEECVVKYYVASPPLKDLVTAVPLANPLSYLTSLSAYIAARMVADGSIQSKGALLPEELTHEERREFMRRIKSYRPPIKIKKVTEQ